MLQQVPASLFSKVFITDQLEERPVERADFLKEKIALQELAQRMVSDPDAVLPRFVELAMNMTGGASAGLSLYQPEKLQFQWRHMCGILAKFEGAVTPRNYSPCGVTLDEGSPVLCRHPEWAYSWVADAQIELAEVLLVPLTVAGKDAAGTLWIATEEEGHFTSEHARVATELATFVGIALHVKRSEEQLKEALEVQETLTREMNHRVKNLFSLADGMIRQSMKHSITKEDMARALSGRLHALASAYSLVLRDDAAAHGHIYIDELIRAVVRPHDHGMEEADRQVELTGATVPCGEQIASSIALTINELATNSAKYGALSSDGGRVCVAWQRDDDAFRLTWTEIGGPVVEVPTKTGFGRSLVETTIVRQLKGSVDYEWLPKGLSVVIGMPLSLFT
jgi:two-component sensor histidine kinase